MVVLRPGRGGRIHRGFEGHGGLVLYPAVVGRIILEPTAPTWLDRCVRADPDLLADLPDLLPRRGAAFKFLHRRDRNPAPGHLEQPKTTAGIATLVVADALALPGHVRSVLAVAQVGRAATERRNPAAPTGTRGTVS